MQVKMLNRKQMLKQLVSMILMISANVNLQKYNHIQKVKLKTSRNSDTGCRVIIISKGSLQK